MTNEGIYEQIVNKRLKNELTSLKEQEYDIELSTLCSADAKKVLSIYISAVIRKGLEFVREKSDDHKLNDKEKEYQSLLRQIKLCNTLIEDIKKLSDEDFFEELKIDEKGEVLNSLYRKFNSALAFGGSKKKRPNSSLTENTLFTGSGEEPSMLDEIKREIDTSDEICLLVSFIRWSAIVRLRNELEQFTAMSHARLKIIATTYMKASEYRAIELLANLPNCEVKIHHELKHARLHAKTYLFKRYTGFSTAYIGSSNLTSPALTDGLEWNIKVTEQESFDIIKKVQATFDSYWNNSEFETFDPNDEEQRNRLKKELSPEEKFSNFKLHMTFQPYPYQQEILDRLAVERNIYGRNKNLVVASTGTGKTVVAAFDYKRFRQQHPNATLLFVAHRTEILDASLRTFREVLNDFNFGSVMAMGRNVNEIDHLFINIKSFNSKKFIENTAKDKYDFIIVDEFHHAAADSYRDLLNYYEPKVLLGLTATPERMDGKDILSHFDGRIASELLLGEAIDRKLICPFQYFGIHDIIDYRNISWKGKYDEKELENLYLATAKRPALVLSSLEKYVNDIEDVKGLGFCVTIKHANQMADYFNEQGVPSISLSSESEDDVRENAIADLTAGKIKFIFTVDLYNEGVDIPCVNTALFLRPTESPTVFLQQLGRGLRLCDGKDYLTVLDFVGRSNSRYNFEMKFRSMIGTTRHSVGHYVKNGFTDLPKGCYIEFEEEAREHILENLQQDTISIGDLTNKLRYFEEDSGLAPTLGNFLDYYRIPITKFYRNTGDRSFFGLKRRAGLNNDSRDIADWKCLNGLLHINSPKLIDFWLVYINRPFDPSLKVEKLMLNMLYYSFYRESPDKKGFKSIRDGIDHILSIDFVKDEIIEILKYNRSHLAVVPIANQYSYPCPLEIHCNYSTAQILAAYGYYNENQAPSFREGVKYFQDKATDIYLINLHKTDKEFSPSTMYDDYAISETLFHWQSQSQNTENSSNIQRYIHHQEMNSNISLFVRNFKKENGFASSYVFLGNADYQSHYGNRPVSFTWQLHTPIPAFMMKEANKCIA